MTSMTTEHTLRMLGDNVTLTVAAWLELLDELRPDSVLAGRIRHMLAVDGKLPAYPPRAPRTIPAVVTKW